MALALPHLANSSGIARLLMRRGLWRPSFYSLPDLPDLSHGRLDTPWLVAQEICKSCWHSRRLLFFLSPPGRSRSAPPPEAPPPPAACWGICHEQIHDGQGQPCTARSDKVTEPPFPDHSLGGRVCVCRDCFLVFIYSNTSAMTMHDISTTFSFVTGYV